MEQNDKSAISREHAIWALVVLLMASFFNYLDRFLVSAMLKDIKDAFDMDHTEGQSLWTAFTIGYMICAPFIGILSERRNRVRIFAVCVAIWSAATIGTGLAEDYWHLLIARLLTGVGEAGCLIVGPILVADYFSRENRGKMLSLFYLGIPLGGAAGFLAGGLLSPAIGWRPTFFVAGFPGLVVAALMWYLREPERGATEHDGAHHHAIPKNATFKDYVRLFRTPSLVLNVLAQSAAAFAIIPVVHGAAEYLENVRGFPRGTAVGLIGLGLVAGVFGNFVGGFVGDRLNRRTKAAYAIVAGVGYTMGLPFMLLGLFAESPWIYSSALFLGPFFLYTCMPAVNTHVANVVPAAHRAVAFAVAIFTIHLLGDTISPLIFGVLSDATGDSRDAFFIFPFILLLSGALFFVAARYTPADVERATKE